MWSGNGSYQNARPHGPYKASSRSRLPAPMSNSRRGINCMPDVPLEDLGHHILQQLLQAQPSPLTALQLAQSYGTYELRSRVNHVLYRVLEPAGLIEQVPVAADGRPMWRLTAEAVTAERGGDCTAASTAAIDSTAEGAATQASAAAGATSSFSSMTSAAAPDDAMPLTYPAAATTAAGKTGHAAAAPGSSVHGIQGGLLSSSRQLVIAAASGDVTSTASRSHKDMVASTSSHQSMTAATSGAAATDSTSSSSAVYGARAGSMSRTDTLGVELLSTGLEGLRLTAAAMSADVLQLGAGRAGSSALERHQQELPQVYDSYTMQQDHADFEQLLEQAYCRNIQPSKEQLDAAAEAIHTVIQQLQQGAEHGYALQLGGQPVHIARACVAGSVGKRTCVTGSFDVDLVLFVDLPAAYKGQVSTLDPDSTHESVWLQQLCKQLQRYCQQHLKQLVEVRAGPSAVSCQLVVGGVSYPHMNISMDLVLAPNLAGNIADKAEAAATQRDIVLQPLLAAGDAWSSSSSGGKPECPVPFGSSARSIWLQESTTQYIRTTAALLSKVGDQTTGTNIVSSMMALTKAWVRKGLQRDQGERMDYRHLKGFMIELLVLKAAQKWHKQLQEEQRQQQSSVKGPGLQPVSKFICRGDSMLNLFLKVLEEAQLWADMAELGKCGCKCSRTGDLQPVLFVDMPGFQEACYTRQQAWGLQKAVTATVSRKSDGWTQGEQCFAQPVVVHPVDPMDSVFVHRRFSLPMWRLFKADAAKLHQELCKRSWQHIRTNSSLAAVVQ